MAIMTNKLPDNEKTRRTKAKPEPVRIDDRGRISVPNQVRKAWNLERGDTLFVMDYGDKLVVRKAINPFDVLAEDAVREYKEGKTQDVRSFAKEQGIDLDE
jgi:AbrB family looped-hinge helix DNA binding protein